MDSIKFSEFQKFSEREQAVALYDILNKNGINCVLEEVSGSYILGASSSVNYYIKLVPQDFEKARGLLLNQSARQVEFVDKRYYLNSFTDEELMEIVLKEDEWSAFDFLCAQKILKERGTEVSAEFVAKVQKERLAFLAQPEKISRYWILRGYMAALGGGIFAIWSGWHLLRHKKILPNGKRVHSYSYGDRKHGMIMFALGILCLLIWITILIVIKL